MQAQPSAPPRAAAPARPRPMPQVPAALSDRRFPVQVRSTFVRLPRRTSAA